jgi:hypothetical protein
VLIPPGDWGATGGSQYKLTPAPYPLGALPWPTEPWLPLPAGSAEEEQPSLREQLADPRYNTYRVTGPPAVPSSGTETCHGWCSSPCGSECSCALIGSIEAGRGGDDPVYPSTMGRCVAIASLFAAGSWLGKRGDGEEGVLGCVCNASYVSFRCCGSEDGVVWEDSLYKLGRLELDSE